MLEFDPRLVARNYKMTYKLKSFEKRYYDPTNRRLLLLAMKPGDLTEEERLALPKIREYTVKICKQRKNILKRAMKPSRYLLKQGE